LHATPGPIGSTTPSSGAFSSLSSTGAVNIGTNTLGAQINLNGVVGVVRPFIVFQSAGSNRWNIGVDSSSENGTPANNGSGFFIKSFTDAGTALSTVLTIARSSGIISMPFGATITGGSLNAAPIGATTPNTGVFTTLTMGTTTGPSWTTGTGAPASTTPIGSLYTNTTGTLGSTLYVSRGGGTWNAVAGV
jgi:hypothetical protein